MIPFPLTSSWWKNSENNKSSTTSLFLISFSLKSSILKTLYHQYRHPLSRFESFKIISSLKKKTLPNSFINLFNPVTTIAHNKICIDKGLRLVGKYLLVPDIFFLIEISLNMWSQVDLKNFWWSSSDYFQCFLDLRKRDLF